MPNYNRTIGAQQTITLPAWRTAMSATNTLYEAGYAWNDATFGLLAKYVWPDAGKGGYLYSGTDGTNSPFHAAYGGSVYADDVGKHGTMIFGGTGEAVIYDQLAQWPLGDDVPQWGLFQQPFYATSEAQAASIGADWYYNPTDAANTAIVPAANVITNEAAFVASWNKTFPCAYQGWVIRRKYQGGINARPHWFRYESPCYIPRAMTGTGAGAILVNQRGTIYGPFSQGPMPSGSTEADWFADVWPSGRRKYYLWSLNTQTKVWTKLAALPDMAYGVDITSDVQHPMSVVDTARKRVYYSTYIGGSYALYYADFSAGQAGVTYSGPTLLTYVSGDSVRSSGNHILCVPRTGALAGKRLWFFKSNSTGTPLGLIDIDGNTVRNLAISGLPSLAEWWCFAYDAVSNTVYITTKETTFGVRSYRFTIPDNYTSAAAYSITMQQVALGGVTLEAGSDAAPWQYGERTRYIDSLGVILLTQRFGKMLAYRPA